jgi:hypothetical protein
VLAESETVCWQWSYTAAAVEGPASTRSLHMAAGAHSLYLTAAAAAARSSVADYMAADTAVHSLTGRQLDPIARYIVAGTVHMTAVQQPDSLAAELGAGGADLDLGTQVCTSERSPFWNVSSVFEQFLFCNSG